MPQFGTFLVVGGDSLVGSHTIRVLKQRGHRVLASTRRPETVGDRRVLLDFENPECFRLPEGVDYVFVIAAATNYERCETDPLARIINEEHIPRLVGNMLKQNAFVTFISTNSVFGGERPWPGENDPHDPRIAYARQKSAGERIILEQAKLLGALDRLNITRLTKVLSRTTSPLPTWLEAWERGETIQPFADLIFAPMSTIFVGNALADIGERRIAQNLHLSGAENVNYVDLAYALAAKLGVDSRLVLPSSARKKGVHIAFKPAYSGLDMRHTTALTGIIPQSLKQVVDDIFADVEEKDFVI